MTQEEKAKAYDEALDRMKHVVIVPKDEKALQALKETIFPELQESNDERIRKSLIKFLIDIKEISESGRTSWAVREDDAEMCKSFLAWLEKQKDASKAIEAVDRIDRYIDEHVANAHDMKDSNPDKKYYRGWDDALGKMSGILQDVYSGKKQKEQKTTNELEDAFKYYTDRGITISCGDFKAKPKKEQNDEYEECTNFTIYHPLKNGKGEYECIPYNFYGSLTSFSEGKDLIDFLRTCFYTEEECNEWIEKQKEQKPNCKYKCPLTDEQLMATDFWKVYLKDSLIPGAKPNKQDIEFLLPTARNYFSLIMKEVCTICKDWSNGYREGLESGEQKSVEWSEEDEKIWEELYEYFRQLQFMSDREFSPSLSIDEILSWLKSFHYSWKLNKEK